MASQFFNMDFEDIGYTDSYNKIVFVPVSLDEYNLIFQELSQNDSIKIFTMHIGVLLDPTFSKHRDNLTYIVTSS
jgi:hypothetical protein